MKLDTMMEKLNELIAPVVRELNYELYHIEYVKEDGEYYLRIYIDSDKGITLEDCAKVSRPISDILDVKDPISDSYYLEVSSPGIYRGLYTDVHLDRYKGYSVEVKLSKSLDEKKVFQGILEGHNDSEISLNINNEEQIIPRDKIKSINLQGEL
jgi:ribosome maturation factor RimP